jgi:hypothetical protein
MAQRRRRVEGRFHICRIEPTPLRTAEEWLSFYARFWTGRLAALAAVLKAEDRAAAAASDNADPPDNRGDER